MILFSVKTFLYHKSDPIYKRQNVDTDGTLLKDFFDKINENIFSVKKPRKNGKLSTLEHGQFWLSLKNVVCKIKF